MKTRLFCSVILMCATSMALDAGDTERLTLRISPVVSFAPANLLIRASILSDPDNRTFQLVLESSDFYRASEIQLNGNRAPRTNTFEFRSLPSGTYEVTGTLMGVRRQERATVRQQISVIASGAQ